MKDAKFSSEINKSLVEKNIFKIINIHSLLFGIKNKSISEIINRLESDSSNSEYNTCMKNILYNYSISDKRLTVKLIEEYFYILDKMMKNTKDKKLKKLIKPHITYDNMVCYNTRNRLCKNCNIEFNDKLILKFCPECKEVKYNSSIIMADDTDEVKYEKKNICKHYEETMKKIYGNVTVDKKLPDGVINELKNILEKRKLNILNSVHYTYTLICQIKDIDNIHYNGTKYIISKYRNQINYILLKLYPELTIPTLSIEDYSLVENTFMKVSSLFQQKFPDNYGNNYMYTIFKIIYSLLPYNSNARNLLRFIYIQKPASFPKKDKKLLEINEELNLLRGFEITPDDIYTRECIYLPED